jgi:phage shock protein E
MGIFDSLFKKEDYGQLVKDGALVVDVRTAEEFKDGHVKGSKNIPLDVIASKTKQLEGKKIVLVCRSGGRASQALSILKSKGIEAVNAGAWTNVKL